MTVRPISFTNGSFLDGRIRNTAILPFRYSAVVRMNTVTKEFIWKINCGTCLVIEGQAQTVEDATLACNKAWESIVMEALNA